MAHLTHQKTFLILPSKYLLNLITSHPPNQRSFPLTQTSPPRQPVPLPGLRKQASPCILLCVCFWFFSTLHFPLHSVARELQLSETCHIRTEMRSVSCCVCVCTCARVCPRTQMCSGFNQKNTKPRHIAILLSKAYLFHSYFIFYNRERRIHTLRSVANQVRTTPTGKMRLCVSSRGEAASQSLLPSCQVILV